MNIQGQNELVPNFLVHGIEKTLIDVPKTYNIDDEMNQLLIHYSNRDISKLGQVGLENCNYLMEYFITTEEYEKCQIVKQLITNKS